MNIQTFISPFSAWFTSDLFRNTILTVFLPFVFVSCVIILIKEILSR